ncbi:hypothetical protein [Haladaptatus caseinilyticus]|uniref:hypothetical protein n=1 Tax=Haladaptatus caseinilyticus TaxID=2993314 RepID=UPI00224A5E46|nr:hypothetical protein [Haladaptatus caseinilyticus]
MTRRIAHESLNVARNTNFQPHPEAACRVGWQTLVPGGWIEPPSAETQLPSRRAI